MLQFQYPSFNPLTSFMASPSTAQTCQLNSSISSNFLSKTFPHFASESEKTNSPATTMSSPSRTGDSHASAFDSANSPSGLGSPSKDWDSITSELERINKAGLMNMLKLISTSKDLSPAYLKETADLFLKPRPLNGKRSDIEMDLSLKHEERTTKKVKLTSNGEYARASWGYLPHVQPEPQQASVAPLNDTVKSMPDPYFSYLANLVCVETRQASEEDKPAKILSLKFDQESQDFIYLVEWKERSDGSKAKNSYLRKEEIMNKDPSVIISYYESQVANKLQNVMAH